MSAPARRVARAAAVIRAAWEQRVVFDPQTTAANALESACMLQSPESAAELAGLRALELGDLDGRVSATCEQPNHPTWLRYKDDTRACPWCAMDELRERVVELEAQRERRRGRLVALQNDALDMRGSLSPHGEARKVPFPLGETLTPAVEWLVARVAELEADPFASDLMCTETVQYQVVGGWGVDGASSAEEALAAVRSLLSIHPGSAPYAQQRTVREWSDGSEHYGPWTDLPPVEMPATEPLERLSGAEVPSRADIARQVEVVRESQDKVDEAIAEWNHAWGGGSS
ncbi:hypothetical protein [Streptomyces sp. NPDC005953]|uniref:hypothetical protein n=1 Tax=Streptomyces sp. NPDC005953 TaxID=3156719 RepID=UPI0033DEDA6E